MRSLYRSLSSFEISPKNEEKDRKHQHKRETVLPPLRTKGVVTQHSGKVVHSSNGDVSATGRNGNRYSNEWIVTRPPKRRPKDELTLEGVMNMETTFSSTYEAVVKELSKQKTDQPVVSCSQTYTEYMPTSTSRPSRRRRKERPKTTLKVGGEGHYRTLTRDSFKNFVVIKNPEQAAETRDSGVNDTGSQITLENEVKAANIDNNVRVADAYFVRPDVVTGSNEKKDDPPPRVVTNHQHSDHESIEQNISTNLAADLKEGDKGMSGNLVAAPASRHPEKEMLLSENRSEIAAKEEEIDADEEIRRINVRENHDEERGSAGCRSYSSGRKSRSERKVDSHFRHLSLPRSRHKHKNDSQLHFYGDMDFETTTSRLYKNCDEKEERAGAKRRVSRARDLFKPSDEVDLFNRHRGQKFDGATTYALCFQDRQYCPVVDLNTSQSEYVFREKTGSHKYYCSLSRLA